MLNLNQFQVINNPGIVAVSIYNAILEALAKGQNSIEVSFNTGEGGEFHDYTLPLRDETGEPVFGGLVPASHQREGISLLSQKLEREILVRAYEEAQVGVWLRTRAHFETFIVLQKQDLQAVLRMADQLRGVGMDIYTAADAAILDRLLESVKVQ